MLYWPFWRWDDSQKDSYRTVGTGFGAGTGAGTVQVRYMVTLYRTFDTLRVSASGYGRYLGTWVPYMTRYPSPVGTANSGHEIRYMGTVFVPMYRTDRTQVRYPYRTGCTHAPYLYRTRTRSRTKTRTNRPVSCLKRPARLLRTPRHKPNRKHGFHCSPNELNFVTMIIF